MRRVRPWPPSSQVKGWRHCKCLRNEAQFKYKKCKGKAGDITQWVRCCAQGSGFDSQRHINLCEGEKEKPKFCVILSYVVSLSQPVLHETLSKERYSWSGTETVLSRSRKGSRRRNHSFLLLLLWVKTIVSWGWKSLMEAEIFRSYWEVKCDPRIVGNTPNNKPAPKCAGEKYFCIWDTF